MADNRDEQQRIDSQEYEFVKERIIERPKKKTPFIVKILSMLVLGLIFGGMGAVSFVLVLPYAQEVFEKQEETTTTGDEVIIPKDDESETTSSTESLVASTPSTEQQSTPDETDSSEPVTEPIQAGLSEEEVLVLIQSALDSKQLEITDYERLYKTMFEIVSEANNSVVTITSVKNNTDIMNNSYEELENTSGIVYNVTENAVFILTDWNSVKEADFIKVSFPSGFACDASVRMYDISSNMAVICVDSVLFDEHSLDRLQAVTLGNSYDVRQGDPVIAVGNPMGYMYTMSYGIVTTVKNTVQSVDAIYRRLDTNVVKSNAGNGFLINLEGELVGLIMSADNGEENAGDSNVLSALALSDLKGRLEIISNNREVAYMGIIGQDITSDIAASQDLPQGIYVSQTIIDSPAYMSGIQNGDIIVAVADMDNMSMKSMRNYLESVAVDDVANVTIMRKGKNGYTDMSFEVTFGAYK